ncbi:MAG: sodium:calcium antiporter [Burkholderiales bacterium]|nr:sodium:calcium antiporter [Burkholderiales bacterium]
MSMTWIALQLVACAGVIGAAGAFLSASVDRLADAHGWGRGWAGLALLSTVTSLPELASGISSVTLVDAPNLAIGDALGSCAFNLVFLAVVDLLQRHQPMYREASTAHLLSAGFGVVMLGFVSLSLVIGRQVPSLLHVGVYSPMLLVLYLLALRSVFGHERALREALPAPGGGPTAVRREWWRFGLAAALVVAAGTWLPALVDGLAQATGLSRSFAGAVFMALATSLPEMAVTLAALRLGALDLAIANLLGSNLFNVTILAVDDLFYTRGPLLAAAAPQQAASASAALLMTGLVIVGLVMRPQGRILRVGSWVSLGLVAAYALQAAVLFLGTSSP